LLEEATALADAVTASGVAAIAEGVRECEVAAEAMRTLFRLGGEYAHVMTPFVASGENMAPPHRICSDKIVRHGDVVFIDIGANWNGYFGDVARTAICGEASDDQKKSTLLSTKVSRPELRKCDPAAPTKTPPTRWYVQPTNMVSEIVSYPYLLLMASASARMSRL